jgi:hypothetical protein
MDSRAKRISIAVAGATGLILVVALAFTFIGARPEPVNAPAIVAAAQAYTHALRLQKLPVPSTVSLQELIDRHFLRPKDAGSLAGMDAAISLTAGKVTPRTPLILVHNKDGTDLVLLADGSTQELNGKR